MMPNEERWAKNWDRCQECGRIEIPHEAKGLCKKCYHLKWRGSKSTQCMDCGVEIDRRATRCHACAATAVPRTKEWNHRLSESTKAHWARGAMDGAHNEECCRKISVGMKAAWIRGAFAGMHDNEDYRRKLSEIKKAEWERGVFDGNSEALKVAWERGAFDNAFRSPTGIELQVSLALDIVEIEHISQYRPEGSRWPFDEFVPPNVLIEVQGDYWHGDNHPEQQERDAEKKQWARKNGFQLIEIWEHEIKELGAEFIVAENLT